MYDETIEQALGRVRAPAELWDRVQNAGVRKSPVRMRKLAWAVAAATMFAGVAWNLPRPEFRSEDPGQLRAWVKSQTGIDVPLAAHAQHLSGARLTRSGVEISYEAGARKTSFSVSKASRGETAHWSSGGQAYIVACDAPGDLDLSCHFCHS